MEPDTRKARFADRFGGFIRDFSLSIVLNDLLWAQPDLLCTQTGRGASHLICSAHQRHDARLATAIALFALFAWNSSRKRRLPPSPSSRPVDLPLPTPEVSALVYVGDVTAAIRAYRLQHPFVTLGEARHQVLRSADRHPTAPSVDGASLAGIPPTSSVDPVASTVAATAADTGTDADGSHSPALADAIFSDRLVALVTGLIASAAAFAWIWAKPDSICTPAGGGWLHVACLHTARLAMEWSTALLLGALLIFSTARIDARTVLAQRNDRRGNMRRLLAEIDALPAPSEAVLSLARAGQKRLATRQYRMENAGITARTGRLRILREIQRTRPRR